MSCRSRLAALWRWMWQNEARHFIKNRWSNFCFQKCWGHTLDKAGRGLQPRPKRLITSKNYKTQVTGLQTPSRFCMRLLRHGSGDLLYDNTTIFTLCSSPFPFGTPAHTTCFLLDYRLLGAFKQTTLKSHRILLNSLSSKTFSMFLTSQN